LQAATVISPLEEKLSEAQALATTKEQEEKEVSKILEQADSKCGYCREILNHFSRA
jgi:hypothetical protein